MDTGVAGCVRDSLVSWYTRFYAQIRAGFAVPD